ncbi:hypothetical protein [Sorangium cellulosum]|uniref:Uncharacterized protein n=1 Tax=Sorangium cellulosum TaxID=56 RepID=A0A150Q9C2_SORCE|nr:hypothetical protein [Sorangium cellulosum]KYF64472.1 hypothetical protein BE15_09520 [Sorangium cellulosum]
MSKASESRAGTVEVSITTFDKGDETVRFTAIGGKITVQELGKKAEPIGLEAAVGRMERLKREGWGITHELVERPAWAV